MNFMRTWRGRVAVLAAAGSAVLADEPVRVAGGGPVHEAFLTPVTDARVIEVANREPPAPLREVAPTGIEGECQWIRGYWAWMPAREDFVWVSGVWRRAPTGRCWIEGFWMNHGDAWLWVRGFWSAVPEVMLAFIPETPPLPVEEDAGVSPDVEFFWSSGFWSYRVGEGRYAWSAGRWERFERDRVWVPPHYVWRPQGYVQAGAYWDWPIELRGLAYEAVHVAPAARATVVHQPAVALEPLAIVDRAFVDYPDYTYFFHHHYFFYPVYWQSCAATPPWWEWGLWWDLSWSDHWGLWWWYGNPGHPRPPCVTPRMADRIPPPPPAVTVKVRQTRPPIIVTPDRRGGGPADEPHRPCREFRPAPVMARDHHRRDAPPPPRPIFAGGDDRPHGRPPRPDGPDAPAKEGMIRPSSPSTGRPSSFTIPWPRRSDDWKDSARPGVVTTRRDPPSPTDGTGRRAPPFGRGDAPSARSDSASAEPPRDQTASHPKPDTPASTAPRDSPIVRGGRDSRPPEPPRSQSSSASTRERPIVPPDNNASPPIVSRTPPPSSTVRFQPPPAPVRDMPSLPSLDKPPAVRPTRDPDAAPDREPSVSPPSRDAPSPTRGPPPVVHRDSPAIRPNRDTASEMPSRAAPVEPRVFQPSAPAREAPTAPPARVEPSAPPPAAPAGAVADIGASPSAAPPTPRASPPRRGDHRGPSRHR